MSLTVLPEHKKNKQVFKENNFLLMEFFNREFTLSNTYCCINDEVISLNNPDKINNFINSHIPSVSTSDTIKNDWALKLEKFKKTNHLD